MNYEKVVVLSLKNQPNVNEAWVRDRIVEDPELLGLGKVKVLGIEKPQPKAGRLDLVLADDDSNRRYAVELMLGDANADHVMRTLEYWDTEKKRLPQFEHHAVLIAENIPPRMLKVLYQINGAVPLHVIKMLASKHGESIGLVFTRILEAVEREDEQDQVQGSGTYDRNWFLKFTNEKSLALVDRCSSLLKEIDTRIGLRYNQQFIGLTIDGVANNFVYFEPRRRQDVRARVRTTNRDDWIERVEQAGLLAPGGDPNRVSVRITDEGFDQYKALLKELFQASYDEFVAE